VRKPKTQSESLELHDRDPVLVGATGVLVGASTDDVLAMISTGVLLDPRLRFDPDSAAKRFLTPPLPVFVDRVETWFESEVDERQTPGSPVALEIESLVSEVGKLSTSGLSAYPATWVEGVIFRNTDECERFRDNLLTLGLEGRLGRIRIDVNPDKFGADSVDSRTDLIEFSLGERQKIQRVFRVTSAIAVSFAARRDKRTTSHAVRLLKGLVKKSPTSEHDGDTPLLDGILSHRIGTSSVARGSIEEIVTVWSNVIIDDDYSNPKPVSTLLENLESTLEGDASFEKYSSEVSRRFTELRNLVDGKSKMSPYSISADTSGITRVLDALQLMVMRRSPLDLLEMPRRDHMASPGVFMLAAYWCGLSTPRTNLQEVIVAEPLLSVLVDLEVNAVSSGESTPSVVSRKFLVETDSSSARRVFDFTVNGETAAAPVGSSWKDEATPPSAENPANDQSLSVNLRREPVARYSLGDYEAEIRDGEIRIFEKEPKQTNRRTRAGDAPKPHWKDRL